MKRYFSGHHLRRLRRCAAGLALAAVSAGLAGCNGFTPPLLPGNDLAGRSLVVSGLPAPGFFIGSAVQWNEEYAVTAAHTPFVTNVVHRCSSGCDVVFVKRKASGRIPQWRAAVPGEEVTSAGHSPFLLSVYGKGIASDTRMLVRNADVPFPLSVHSAAIVKGMSGGPLYGSDGKVLGINIGLNIGRIQTLGQPTELSPSRLPRVSYYIPYHEIEKEWRVFQDIQAGAQVQIRPFTMKAPKKPG